MRNRVLENKCLAFAVRIVNLHQFLQQTSKEFVLSKQILRSGTSIGANVAEAIYAQSGADFFFENWYCEEGSCRNRLLAKTFAKDKLY